MTKKTKKDNSKPSDSFINCRSCGEYIKGDNRSTSDKRYLNQRIISEIFFSKKLKIIQTIMLIRNTIRHDIIFINILLGILLGILLSVLLLRVLLLSVLFISFFLMETTQLQRQNICPHLLSIQET